MDISRKVRIAYNGSGLTSGEMDVRDLAPALLAFASLVNKANEVIGGERPVKVLLNQDSIRKGSFDVTMLLDMDILDQARMLVGMANENGLTELLIVLGWGANVKSLAEPVVSGVFHLIKAMSGRNAKSIEYRADGNVNVALEDNSVIVTDGGTLNVYLNVDARKYIEQVVKPVTSDGIDSFELRNPDRPEEKEAVLSIMKENVSSFAAPDTTPSQEETFPEQEMVVRIVSASLQANYAWRLSNGETTFQAPITDEQFLKDLAARKYTFGAGDMLHVKYIMKQSITGKGNISVERTITKVIKVIPKPAQLTLPLNEKTE